MSIERRRHFRELSLQVLFFIDSVYPEILGKPKRIAVSSTSDDPNNSVEPSEPRSKLVRKGVRKRISKAASQIDLHTNDATDNNQPLTDDERLTEGNRVLNDFWLNFKESSQETNSFFYF
ncbi:MAG: hypothetical protein OMM_09418 [Candidatus Magnetoglobus multicellularis str. Araruama]|uniref:Uncharacterized protein n=1 Tax=Candidatus Magnetoglobus multicellularis str. Araruama TaxID=890399 RepID=A0A1V1P4B7_9BACT|nr:MAG: hypothetical protein OMM_09418 [Candidatus Magnetoglobus multicellularis str. Araruama]